MIERGTLECLIDIYLNDCNYKPTKKGLSEALGISTTTVHNVCTGLFNGHPYTQQPHIKRLIDNNDFCLITELFDKGKS